MTTIVWSVTQMDCYPTYASQTDVVFTVYWDCVGTQDQYTARSYGTCQLTYEAGSAFTPYAQLTQDEVLSWIWNAGVNQQVIEQGINDKIALEQNPPTIALPLPWVA